jgi:A/G-specific adenine glycosylase
MTRDAKIIFCKDNKAISQFKKVYREKGLSRECVRFFQQIIYRYYRHYARNNLPWRKTQDPYHILVSEIMLQQTQVERVIQKYDQFLSFFPDMDSLAQAPLKKILSVWQGMGYNRRAMSLQQITRQIAGKDFHGVFPSSVDVLMDLPGIGRATASAVAAFAFQQPVVFIETNIRRVFIFFFFQHRKKISDSELIPFVEKTLDRKNSRQWYYALMDYGAMLAKVVQNPNRKSRHYQKQAPFKGSNRQIRGIILRTLISQPDSAEQKLIQVLRITPDKVRQTLKQLQKEGFIKEKKQGYVIS